MVAPDAVDQCLAEGGIRHEVIVPDLGSLVPGSANLATVTTGASCHDGAAAPSQSFMQSAAWSEDVKHLAGAAHPYAVLARAVSTWGTI
jgi:hypothetical protein